MIAHHTTTVFVLPSTKHQFLCLHTKTETSSNNCIRVALNETLVSVYIQRQKHHPTTAFVLHLMKHQFLCLHTKTETSSNNCIRVALNETPVSLFTYKDINIIQQLHSCCTWWNTSFSVYIQRQKHHPTTAFVLHSMKHQFLCLHTKT